MKKTLIALAVLAAAGAASAQSSVTLFGVVDVALEHGRGNVADRTQLTSGAYNTSRIGFRGTEDLGGGMSGSFWLEAGINVDNGTGQHGNITNQPSGAALAGLNAGAGLTFARRSTVSLAGGWGELRLGRDIVPQYWNHSFDPFGNVGVGTAQNFLMTSAQVTAVRASNSIGYFTPQKLGGFYGQAMYYLGENLSNAPGNTDDDGRGAGIRVGFANGPFNVALGFGRTDYATGDFKQVNLGGSWNFGIGRVQGIINRDSIGNTDLDGWLVGALFPIGAGEVRASFSRSESDAPGKPTAKKVALGYVHNLSKRTAVYTTLARVKNSGGAAFALGGSVAGANSSSTGFDLGVRHAF